MDHKKISIHLVTFNGERYIPLCLKALQEQSEQNFSVLIIDNHSRDQTASAIENYLYRDEFKHLSKVTRFIKNAKNLGFAGAHNQAIQWTKSEYVFMVNQDIYLHPDYLKHIVTFLDTHTDAGSATGALFQWDVKHSDGLTIPTKIDKIDSLGLKIHRNHRVTEYTTGPTGEEPEAIFGVSGALPIYRRSALEHTKIPLFYKSSKLYTKETTPKLYEYFDNDFFAYKEDIDLAYRLQLFGYTSYLIPKAIAWHDRTAASRDSIIKNRRNKSSFINYHSYKNHLNFLVKNVPAPLIRSNFHKIFLYETGKFLYICLREFKTLTALNDFFATLPKMLKKRRYIHERIGKDAWKRIYSWLS